MPVGSLFHYVKSNRDGSHAGQVYAYVASATRLDVVKHEPNAGVSVNILAELDWQTFSPSRLEMWYDHADGARHRVFHVVDDGAGLVLALDDPRGFDEKMLEVIGPEPRRVPVAMHPVHVYGFELLSLDFSLPHRVDPRQPLTFGLVGDNPHFGPDSPALLAYRGEAWLHWVGEEPCGAALCQRYRMGGPGLGGQEGFVSVDSERQHIVQLELPVPNNREWNDFALRLESVRELAPEDWQAHKRQAIARYFAQR